MYLSNTWVVPYLVHLRTLFAQPTHANKLVSPFFSVSTFKWHRYRQMKWKKTHAACLFVNAGMFCTLVPERIVSRVDYVILKTPENCLLAFAIFTSHKAISWNPIFWELLLNTLSTKPIKKRTASLHMVTVLRQPVAKMLRHFTRKTLFLPKHRIKSHISKIKQLPSPSPIFNVVLRKFQHDLLLWPTLRRGRGGSKTRGPYRYPWRAN